MAKPEAGFVLILTLRVVRVLLRHASGELFLAQLYAVVRRRESEWSKAEPNKPKENNFTFQS
jgi:hypothetical protein